MTDNRKAFEQALSSTNIAGAYFSRKEENGDYASEFVHAAFWGYCLALSTLPMEAIQKAADMLTEYANDAAIDENPEMASTFNNYSRQLRTLIDQPCSGGKV